MELKERPLLTTEDIEVKVKQVTKTGALALLYKTARTDRKYLNEIFGPLNWTSDYKVIKDNLYCGIGAREKSTDAFVWKWDCGIESREDDDGNQKKGEASDAFKRAGYQWGIGEELYTAPKNMWLDVATVQDGGKYRLQDPYAQYVVTEIDYNKETRVITHLVIANAKSNIVVYTYDMSTTGATAQKMSKTVSGIKTEPQKISLQTMINKIGNIVKKIYEKDGDAAVYERIIAEVAEPGFKCNKATDKDYVTVEKIYNKLLELKY